MRLARKTTMLAVIVGLAATGAAIPATARADGGNGGGVAPPTTSSNGGTYSVTVQGNVSTNGDVTQGGGSGSTGGDPNFTPPACWLQPWYHQPESWTQGDPVAAGSPQGVPDADSFWWYMADHYPGMIGLIAHVPDARQDINNDFEMVQKGTNDNGGGPVGADWIWWAPNWVNTAAGWACAQNLVSTVGMNNGFLDLEPPSPPGKAIGPGEITGSQLAGLARASLRLPILKITMKPSGLSDQTSSYVNAPTSYYITYQLPGQSSAQARMPHDSGKVMFLGQTWLTAKVWTSAPTLTVTASGPAGADTTTGFNRDCESFDPCKVTFQGPTSSNDLYSFTVSATWNVYWAATGAGGGQFPPTQPVRVTQTVVVREIQSIN